MKLAACLFLLASPAILPAQTAPTSSAPLPTLTARAKIVVVDVVVKDRSQRPVHGLKQQDFTLLENKVPQTISNFEEHMPPSASELAKVPAPPVLPPGVFTNIASAPPTPAVTVLLLDSLNTPLSDQKYLRQELLRYLKTPHPGQNVAIFGLNSRLVLLQGFTSDQRILLAAANRQIGRTAPIAADPTTVGGSESTADTAAAFGTPNTPGVADAIAGLQFLQNEAISSSLQVRAKYTLDALNILARYLSSIHGRKNLVWFSGEFPIDLTSTANAGNFSNPGVDLPSGEAEYRDTINLLTRSQVAVYPVNPAGVQAPAGFDAANGVSLNPVTPLNDTSGRDRAGTHMAMNRIAEDSGGHAFYNSNDLSQVLTDAIADGSSYYTLTYTPTNTAWKDDFRTIKVQLAQRGYELSYRRGYFATNPSSRTTALAPANDTAGLTTLGHAMVHGVPGPTEILFKARVRPTTTLEDTPGKNNVYTPAILSAVKTGFRRYLVEFDAEGHDFTFTPLANGKFELKLEYLALLYQADGRLADNVTNRLVAQVDEKQRARILYAGLPLALEVSVPRSGAFSLRLGLRDEASDRVGATELPLAQVANLPPVELPSHPAGPAPSAPPAK